MANKSGLSITRRPPKASAQFETVRNEVRVGLNRVAGKARKRLSKFVANWSNQPSFDIQVGSGPKALYFRVFIRGNQKSKFIFRLVDKGARPHVIRIRNAQALRFTTGYQAKTGPGGKSGGSGRATGSTVFTKQVNHPGHKGRDITGIVKEEIKPDLDREIYNGYRRGFRKGKR